MSFACSPEDKLIDNTTNRFNLLLTTNESNKPIKILQLPENNVIENDNTNKLNVVLDGKIINKTKKYLDKLYFIIEEEATIYVFNSDTYDYIDKYVFDQSRTPIDIAFSNATDAYVLYKNKSALTVVQNNIGLIDIYFNKFVKDIDTEYPSDLTSIAAHKNMLYLGFSDKNIGKFDIRDNKLKSTTKIRNICNLITVTFNNDILLFIDGDSTNNLKSTVIYINQNEFTNQKEVEINLFGVSSNILQSNSVVNSPKEYTFFATNQGLLRLDSRNRANPSFISSEIYNLCRYNERNSSLILIKNLPNGSVIDFADNETGDIKSSYSINYKIMSLLPL
ncbi:MAG: hypothetical protein ACOVNU_03660 [Candidatus Kapaibacteriota bacterium]|jgi:hypothetical protein